MNINQISPSTLLDVIDITPDNYYYTICQNIMKYVFKADSCNDEFIQFIVLQNFINKLIQTDNNLLSLKPKVIITKID